MNLRLVSIPVILQKNFGFSCGYCYEGVLRGIILEIFIERGFTLK
jgi:hypothetical protein